MNTGSLQERSIRSSDGRYCHRYHWEGSDFLIHDDALTCLNVCALFADDAMNPEDKLLALFDTNTGADLFADTDEVLSIGTELWRFIAYIVWETCGIDLTGAHESECDGQKVIDWDKDASYIKTTLLTAYGIYWDDISQKITYAELVDLVSLAPHETPMGQALYYRTAKPPKRTKYNTEEVEHFRKAREFYALDNPCSVKSMNNQLSDLLNAFKRRCR